MFDQVIADNGRAAERSYFLKRSIYLRIWIALQKRLLLKKYICLAK